MSEVYIVSEYNWADYEGGGAVNHGVYHEYDSAFAGLKKFFQRNWGDGRKKLPRPEWNEEEKMWEFHMPCIAGEWIFRIEKWEVL